MVYQLGKKMIVTMYILRLACQLLGVYQLGTMKMNGFASFLYCQLLTVYQLGTKMNHFITCPLLRVYQLGTMKMNGFASFVSCQLLRVYQLGTRKLIVSLHFYLVCY